MARCEPAACLRNTENTEKSHRKHRESETAHRRDAEDAEKASLRRSGVSYIDKGSRLAFAVAISNFQRAFGPRREGATIFRRLYHADRLERSIQAGREYSFRTDARTRSLADGLKGSGGRAGPARPAQSGDCSKPGTQHGGVPGIAPLKPAGGRLTDSLSLGGEPVSLQEHSPLLRKSEPSMMLSLISNVCFRLLDQRRTDTRRRIPRLPLEESIAEISVAPFRRSGFDELHRLRQRHGGRKGEHDMGMIVKAADRDGHDSVCASNSRHKRPESWLHHGRNDPGSILRAEDAMYSVGDI